MNLESALARLEYILTGRVEQGECPQCNHRTVTITDRSIKCEYCDFGIEGVEAPSWL